ncbi:unnamed protein product [Thelazia callipaeda]|uniref:FBA_2 domain-containing protein n=1 Tax=Thelazia callipaeda TaxID=103827 RepID=A0A0N5CKH0_THECL|nr:unnamed protein product [Thelazia callipaeda]
MCSLKRLQDCQLYFVEYVNNMLIKSLKVDRNNIYCHPNLVKLHLRQGTKQISLMLTMKQAGNQICLLPIEMPSLETIKSEQIFSYSVFTSLPYSACSQLKNDSFILEPDLSFIDTTFSDIIYFINSKLTSRKWDILQFWINENGNLVAIRQFVIHYPEKGTLINTVQFNPFIVHLDMKRSVLYILNRLQRNLLYQCSFDLLFRSSSFPLQWLQMDEIRHPSNAWLESFSIDDQLMLFTELSNRVESKVTSVVYITNLRTQNSIRLILQLDFATDIGLLKKGTYEELSKRNIPAFGNRIYTLNF